MTTEEVPVKHTTWQGASVDFQKGGASVLKVTQIYNLKLPPREKEYIDVSHLGQEVGEYKDEIEGDLLSPQVLEVTVPMATIVPESEIDSVAVDLPKIGKKFVYKASGTLSESYNDGAVNTKTELTLKVKVKGLIQS